MADEAPNRTSVLLAGAVALLVIVVGASFLLRAPDAANDVATETAKPAASTATTPRTPTRNAGPMISARPMHHKIVAFSDGGVPLGR